MLKHAKRLNNKNLPKHLVNVNFSVSMRETTREAISEKASEADTTRSDMIEKACLFYLKHNLLNVALER